MSDTQTLKLGKILYISCARELPVLKNKTEYQHGHLPQTIMNFTIFIEKPL